jgi:exosortase/archaeosortase family protein
LALNKFFTYFPQPVASFLKRAFFLFVLWKAVYILFLIPNEIPDAWVVKKLGSSTAAVLNVFYATASFEARDTRRLKTYGNDQVWVTHSYVFQSGKRAVIGIYQACDGVELMVLTAGFILCFNGPSALKFRYIMVGILGLFFLNVLRCSLLAVVNLEIPQHFQFAHKYLFNLFVYGFTFLLWMSFVNKVKPSFSGTKGNTSNVQ